jgi:hypothetical protein
MYSVVNRKKKPPNTSTKHVINREYCKLWNITAGSSVRYDDTLEESDSEPLVLAEYEMSEDANTGFSASET